ncbi:MAG: DUF4124 domain-containing protein [Burkholderiaceae bacterium]|nr:DUF4124 domain-containing protein [Burkholderiaceae bacterium]
MSRFRSLPVFLAPAAVTLAGMLLTAAASAGTWQWRDASGRMVYSDLPPPPEVRASQIVRAPASAHMPAANTAAPAGPEAGADDAPRANAPAAAAATPRSWVEKEAEFRKRTLEREEAGKKEQEQRDQAARIARACEQSRGTLRMLESGTRMATITASGEREVLEDRERARRVEELRGDIARNCARPGG